MYKITRTVLNMISLILLILILSGMSLIIAWLLKIGTYGGLVT